MSPSEGERRLISAIAPSPGERRASSKRTGEPRQLVETGCGCARGDGLAGQLEPLAQVLGVPGGSDRAGRVEEDRVPPAAAGSREDLADRGRVLLRRPPGELGRVAAFDAEVQRV